MNELLKKLYEVKEKERLAKEERLVLEGEIYTMIEKQLDDDKTLKIEEKQYRLQVKPSYSISVNQDYAKKYPEVFSAKYSLSYSQYKKIKNISDLDNNIEIKQLKPSFSVEMI